VIVCYRLHSERRVLMSDVRLPPTITDTTTAGVKEGDEIEVSSTTVVLCVVTACLQAYK